MPKGKKTATVRMLVVVPRLPELTLADQRRSVRDTLKQTGDYYGRRVSVTAIPHGVPPLPAPDAERIYELAITLPPRSMPDARKAHKDELRRLLGLPTDGVNPSAADQQEVPRG